MSTVITARSWTGALALVLLGCNAFLPDAPEDATLLAGPVDGLTGQQAATHARGDAEFARPFGAIDGLGPIFDGQACESCHAGDGKGHPFFTLIRFGRMVGADFDPMRDQGGPQLQRLAIQRYVAEQVPSGATAVAGFTPPAVSGLGFLEAVDDTTLLRLADPDDADGDGISGRVQLLAPDDLIVGVTSLDSVANAGTATPRLQIGGRYIGRFGKKGITVNLLQQVVTAYHQDMGLTTDLIPTDIFNPQTGSRQTDDIPDPEVPQSVVDAVVFYLKTLRAPPRREASHPDVRAGETLFAAVGCGGCHTATLRTGASPIAALNQTEFHPYTDLLLHDMGPELDDGYTEGVALSSEWRTAPLWGVGLAARSQGGTSRLLHDGRATTLHDAIRLHGGEAAAARAAYDALTPAQREQLRRFLESL